MCNKRLCLWTSCPSVWSARSLKLVKDLTPFSECIAKTSKVEKVFLKASMQLEEIPKNYFKNLCKLPKAERVVRDVLTVLGIIVHAKMEPFCNLKTMLKTANEVPLISWPICKQMVSKDSFFLRIKTMSFNDNESDTLARLRPFLRHKHMNPQFVRTRCHHASKLAQWAHKFFIYCLKSKSLCRKGRKS